MREPPTTTVAEDLDTDMRESGDNQRVGHRTVPNGLTLISSTGTQLDTSWLRPPKRSAFLLQIRGHYHPK